MTGATKAANSSLTRRALQDAHAYWFGDLLPPTYLAAPEKVALWFEAPREVDDWIRTAFGSYLEPARSAGWRDLDALSPEEQIGLVVLLDQFPRHIFRQTGEQFAYDATALDLARRLVAGDRRRFRLDERKFLFLPFQHSEDAADQDRSVALFSELACQTPAFALESARLALDYATKHRDVIRKFGRFPHRNALLGRDSTPEEVEFLKDWRGF